MKKILLLLAGIAVVGIVSSYAQVKTVSGTVINSANRKPLSGVTVVVTGSTLGTITNDQGEYHLNVPEKAKSLTFSFIGMKTERKTITGSEVNAELESTYVGLDEVMVLGYVRKNKNKITGSVVQVDGEDIANIPVTSFDQALQGKVPGLNIFTTSGTPGSVSDIRIRGVGTITAGNSPLFVIDGVPVINEDFSGNGNQSSLSSLAAINSHDIESITVLKDASATSAYGARGSNGVIVVTTKKGKPGKTGFSANASVGFQNNAVTGPLPLTGAQKAELLGEAAFNTFGESNGFTEDEAQNYLTEVLNVSALKNWNGEEGNWDELLQNKNAPVQNYDVSASGGDAISSFYASLGYSNTEATVIGANFERLSAKFNYNRRFSASVNFATNILVSDISQHGIVEPSVYFRNPHMTRYFMSPWIQPYLEDGTLNINPSTSVVNTLYTIKNDILTNDLTRGITNSYLEWKVLENLKIKTLFATDYNITAYHNYVNRIHGDGVNAGGFTNQSVSRNFNFVSQNSLDYNYSRNKHNIFLKAIMEYQENRYNYLSGHGEKFPANGLHYLASAGANFDAGSLFTDWKNVSYLGMVNYDYALKYIADFTYRREGSSKFAPGRRFGNFWSVGAAWNISEEDFLKGNLFIENLKLKAAYGVSGNSAIGINRYQPLLSFDSNYAGEGAIYPGQYGNSALTWEKNQNFNAGVDYALVHGRINGSVSYYRKNTFDLLQDVPLSLTTGHDFVLMNAGAINNNGVEAMLNLTVVRSQEFNLSVSANVATVENEVTELATDAEGNEINIETTTQRVAKGHPVFGWYMREWAGVNSETGSAMWYLNGKGSEVTENYYDPEIQKVWLGSPIPKYTGGFGLHADFKGFFADAALYFAGGHKVYEDFSFFTHHSGIYSTLYYNGVQAMLDRWQQPGDITEVPKVIYGINSDSDISSRFLYDGDYARLKELVFGYRIPKNMSRRIGFDGIILTARGTNLFTWVKDNRLKYDPDVRAGGFTRLNTPPVKSIVFGINLKF
ncbi:MAG: SusC/RagA family TonB-linked outer membrane protein [Prolixibacteraceae bacterium]